MIAFLSSFSLLLPLSPLASLLHSPLPAHHRAGLDFYHAQLGCTLIRTSYTTQYKAGLVHILFSTASASSHSFPT